MMITTNQNAALSEAHVQPSPSSSPNRTRPLPAPPAPPALPALPVLSVCPAIVLHPLRRPTGRRARVLAGYLTVRVPVMFGWTAQWNVYAPAARAGTL